MFEVNFSLDIHKIYFANVMLIHQLTRHWLPSKYPPVNSNQFNFYAMHIMSSVARRTCLVSLFEKCSQVKHLLEKGFLAYSLNTTIFWKSDSLEDAYSTMQVDIFWCFPSNMLKIQNVNVLLAFHSRAMNQEQSDILCCPQDVNTNKFCPLPFIFEHFPPQTRMLCHAISKQIVYSQHKIILSQQQPSIGPTWIHFKLARIRPFRCGCSIGMQHPKHAPDH